MKVALILAGGVGERFWPLSTKTRPKQVIKLWDEKPLVKHTIDRLKDDFDKIFLVTPKEQVVMLSKVVPPQDNIEYIAEPSARGTAAAIGYALTKIKKLGDPTIFVETVDHYYKDVPKYLSYVRKAVSECNENIILIGIKPITPHTGYGYIQAGEKTSSELFNVEKFHEKPNEAKANEYLSAGNFYWNSGMLVAKCSVLLKEVETHLPNHFQTFKDMQENPEKYNDLANVSFDIGVLEKSTNLKVLAASMHWADVGDLRIFEDFHRTDDNGNVINVKGKIAYSDVKNNIIASQDPDIEIAVKGVENLVIVKEENRILVISKDHLDSIRDVIREINH